MRHTTKKERELLRLFKPAAEAFLQAMIKKFLANERKYQWGNAWMVPDWERDLQAALPKHIAKGDPIDMGIYSVIAHYHGWATAPAGTAQTMTFTTAKASLERFVYESQVDGAILFFRDGSWEKYEANWRNKLGKEWVEETKHALLTRPLPQVQVGESTLDEDQAGYMQPKKRYIVDYTAGRVLDEVLTNASTVASLVESGIVGKFLSWVEQYPGHHLALSDTDVLPGPALGVSEQEYPALCAYKLAHYNFDKVILPYLQGRYVNLLTEEVVQPFFDAATIARKKLEYIEQLGINMQQVGTESISHARALRNSINESANVAHRVTVQKGTPEELMSPEQLAAYEADGGMVVRKKEYTPDLALLGNAESELLMEGDGSDE